MSSVCPHINTVGQYSLPYILKKREQCQCDSCDCKGPHLWACLHRDCMYVGCGESAQDHSLKHYQETCHTLIQNLSTLRVWCYICECEVFLENNTPISASVHPRNHVETAAIHKPNPVANKPLSSSALPPSSAGTVDDESDFDDDEDQNLKPRGLTGLQNIGNTCYMNAALQALSNCPPLTRFFLNCSSFVKTDKKPGLSKNYLKLMMEMWHKRRPGYVVPSSISYGIKLINPMFRGYTQQDSQEFLRCFMDQLHEELKEPLNEAFFEEQSPKLSVRRPSSGSEESSSQSETEYETCDSGLSSDRSSCNGDGCESNELRSKEKHQLCNKYYNRKDVCFGTDENKMAISKLEIDAALFPGATKDVVSMEIKEVAEFIDAVSELPQVKDFKRPISQHPVISWSTDGETTTTVRTQCKSTQLQQVKYKVQKKKKSQKYRSVISDVFDGKILSSVQCLTCDRVSSTKETFQDLSLPIPSRDHLHMLHATQNSSQKGVSCTEVYTNQGWLYWMFGWMKSWFWGPTITLQDCLAAFFSADDLKGDNMYSCEKCKKLRNGIKYSRVLELPEILCIHLKRFRHEFMFSSKINSFVSFPLEGLDVKHFLHPDCPSKVTTYELVSVICHHGTAGGGHYTTYALNFFNHQWYEFDDTYVTEVELHTVQSCEAYVLFYRKISEDMNKLRQKAMEWMTLKEPSLMQFYVSKQWLNKFNTFSEPGYITNTDFLCQHGGVLPSKWEDVELLVTPLPQPVWELLHEIFGGGPACNHLYICPVCQEEADKLERWQKMELETFIKLNQEFQNEENPNIIFAINMAWFKLWENFVRQKENEPPGPIDNSSIAQPCVLKSGHTVMTVKPRSDYGQMSEKMWHFLHSTYSGGPEVILQQATPRLEQKVENTIPRSEQKVENAIPRSEQKVENTIPRSEQKVESTIPRSEQKVESTIPRSEQKVEKPEMNHLSSPTPPEMPST